MARRHRHRHRHRHLSAECARRQHGQSDIQQTRMSVPVKFLKSVCRSTIEEKKLRLPSQLMRNFGNKLTSELAILGFPNGFFMRVRLSQINGKIWIDTTKLVNRCHLREGFILEFTYKGFCNFEVSIFDPSSNYFQIEYPCDNVNSSSSSSDSDNEQTSSKQCSLHRNDVERDEDSVKSNGSTLELHKGQSSRRQTSFSKKNLRKSSVAVGLRTKKSCKNVVSTAKRPDLKRKLYQTRSKTRLSEEEAVCTSDEEERISETKKNEKPTTRTKRSKTNKKEVKSIASRHFRSLFNKVSGKTKRAINAANKFKPQNPSFCVILRPYNFPAYSLIVPSEFSKKYMDKVSKQITLVGPDRTKWLVKVRVTRLGYMNFGDGLKIFAKHNRLKEGDVCLFELIRSKGFTLKVSIFRC